MKHDRLRRQRRHADPSVIHLPSQLPSHAPPSMGSEVDGANFLDGEIDLLARTNIFETEPRMSRQARRKALRAEQKAARRAATERFLVGAPSMAEAVSQFEEAEPPIEWTMDTPLSPSEHEAAVAHLADLLVAERPLPVPIFDEDMEQSPALEEIEEAAVSDKAIAEIISASGPLVVAHIDPEGQDDVLEASAVHGPVRAPAANGAGPEATAVEAEMAEPAWLEAAPEAHAEAMTAPLPRNRSLVAHKRHWLLRLVPWLSRRPAPTPETAMAQLQELRFELVTALRKLDQIIERTA